MMKIIIILSSMNQLVPLKCSYIVCMTLFLAFGIDSMLLSRHTVSQERSSIENVIHQTAEENLSNISS